MFEVADDKSDGTIVTDFVYDRNNTNKNLENFSLMPLFPDQK